MRFVLAWGLALGMGSVALAQNATTNGATATATAQQNGTTQTGVAKPPQGTVAPAPHKTNPADNSAIGANVPTLPQIALHPTGTVGSTTAIAGPGGTTRSAVGGN